MKTRWPNGIACHHCGSTNVQTGAKHKSMPFRCREKECRKRFSTKTGTVMQGSNLDYQTWAIAIYLSLTSLKSVASMKLHRDLKVTQKTAWHLAHRLREAYDRDGVAFGGPVGSGRDLCGRQAKQHAEGEAQDPERTGNCGQVCGYRVERPGNKRGTGESRLFHRCPDPARLRAGQHRTGGDGVHGRGGRPIAGWRGTTTMRRSITAPASISGGQAGINGMESFLVDAQACAQGHFPQDQPETSRSVRRGVRRDAIMSGTRTRWTRWPGSSPVWRAGGSATETSPPITGSTPGRGPKWHGSPGRFSKRRVR